MYVYILSSKSRVLYTGVTNDIKRRTLEHKQKTKLSSFTARYNVTRLVHIEETPSPHAAIQREKEIKGWSRKKKIALINSQNPGWHDLSDGWFDK